jgi:ribulose-phosphate 3-epimerase
VGAVEKAGADLLHVDIMDGRFVPNITIGPPVVAAIKRCAKLPLDVHLMIVEPEKYIEAFADAGADILTVHAEATPHLQRAVARVRELGKKAGVSLNPSTSLSAIEWVLTDIDMVLLMSVNPGFGGQEYLPSMTGKIELLRSQLVRSGLPVDIEVDGGIKTDNVAEVVRAGANVIVSGSGIFKTKDYGKTISEMRDNIRKAVSASA